MLPDEQITPRPLLLWLSHHHPRPLPQSLHPRVWVDSRRGSTTSWTTTGCCPKTSLSAPMTAFLPPATPTPTLTAICPLHKMRVTSPAPGVRGRENRCVWVVWHPNSRSLIGEQYRPLRKWKRLHRHLWLNELLRSEGRGDHAQYLKCVCGHPNCPREAALIQCQDCNGGDLLGMSCVVRDHQRNPMYRIRVRLLSKKGNVLSSHLNLQRWDPESASFNDDIKLKDLGLRIVLGQEYHPNRQCPRLRRAWSGKQKFVVLDVLGVHEVDVWYCDCGKGPALPVQLLRNNWLPSTGSHPRTAATFTLMRHYHLMSLESKCSMGEFYNCLARQSNNTGEPPKVSAFSFIPPICVTHGVCAVSVSKVHQHDPHVAQPSYVEALWARARDRRD